MTTGDGNPKLVRFLQTHDLDILHDLYTNMGRLETSDADSIIRVITEWQNEQAIANLLFFPLVIPVKYRFHSLMKALHEDAAPYYTLAAVVGLQTINPADLNIEQRELLVQRLLELIREEADVISSRASVSIWEFLDDSNFTKYLKLYPVRDTTANKNILAYTMMRFAETPKNKFRKNLRAIQLPWGIRRKIFKHFKKFKKSQRNGSDVFMRAPVYEDVPNLRDVDQRVDNLAGEMG